MDLEELQKIAKSSGKAP